MQKLLDADTEMRSKLSGRIWDAGKLSLAGLADRVSPPSKRRAEQQAKDAAEDDNTPV